VAGRVLRCLAGRSRARQSPEGGYFRSLRTQQRAYGRRQFTSRGSCGLAAVLTMLN
jgi:hypothetical protein